MIINIRLLTLFNTPVYCSNYLCVVAIVAAVLRYYYDNDVVRNEAIVREVRFIIIIVLIE